MEVEYGHKLQKADAVETLRYHDSRVAADDSLVHRCNELREGPTGNGAVVIDV